MSDISIDPSARIAPTASLRCLTLNVGAGVVIEDGAIIEGEHAVLRPGATIGTRVEIRARRIFVGSDTKIEANCKLSAIGTSAERIAFGDNCFLGENSTVLVPIFLVGDYVAIHRNLLANGYKACLIGHNSWIGQNSVLNSTDRLFIGNSVGIGAYSSIYTHAMNGELLEGCTVASVAPVVIEDNVWVVGSYNVISPGVRIGRRAVIMTSSVVTRDVAPGTCVAGVPARDMSGKLGFFKDVTIEQKIELMRGFVREYVESRFNGIYRETKLGFSIDSPTAGQFDVLVIGGNLEDISTFRRALVYAVVEPGTSLPEVAKETTVFDLVGKTYTKKRSVMEIMAIRFMNGYRARFVPANMPIVDEGSYENV